MPPLLTLPFSKKERLMVLSDRNMPNSFDGFCSLWLEADPGGRMWVMHPPTGHFQKNFLMHTIFP